MPSSVRGPKTLFEWVEPDYYRRSRWLRRWVRVLGWGALLVGAGIVAATLWKLPSFYQAGPLTSAHSMFSENCEQCHKEAFATATRFRPEAAAVHSVTDEACTHCHEGGPHHADQQVSVPACAGCHHEHRGETALMRVPDTDCVACHGDLRLKDGTAPPVGNVHSFATDHPPFHIPAKDPGHVHFNHALHLQEGGILSPGGKPEQLVCASCHAPSPDRRYMRPVHYEDHCARCHPLSVRLVGDWKDEGARQAAGQFNKRPAPHVAALEVRAALRDRVAELVRDHPAVVASSEIEVPPRLIPGHVPADAPPAGDARAWMDYQLGSMEHVLFDGADSCRRCHVEAPGSRTPDQPGALPVYEPSNLLTRWLQNGIFDHNSHQMLKCAECHAQATTSTQATDVMLPDIRSCQGCHNPTVGVRSDCIDCHRYHEHTTRGGWKGTFTIDEALRPSQKQHP